MKELEQAALDEIEIFQSLVKEGLKNSVVGRIRNSLHVNLVDSTRLFLVFVLIIDFVLIYQKYGPSLGDLNASYNYRGLPIPILKFWTKQMLTAIATLRKYNVIHTDITPHSFVLEKQPNFGGCPYGVYVNTYS